VRVVQISITTWFARCGSLVTAQIIVLGCCDWHAEISASIYNDLCWIADIITFKTWEWSGSVIDFTDCGILLLSCTGSGGEILLSGPALWGSGLSTRKMLSPKFSSEWMIQAQMISGRHSGFHLGPDWSGLGKILRLAVSLGTILMKWAMCRDSDENWNLTTIDIPFASSFSENHIEKEGSRLIHPLTRSFSENLWHYLYFTGGAVEVSLGIWLDASWLADN